MIAQDMTRQFRHIQSSVLKNLVNVNINKNICANQKQVSEELTNLIMREHIPERYQDDFDKDLETLGQINFPEDVTNKSDKKNIEHRVYCRIVAEEMLIEGGHFDKTTDAFFSEIGYDSIFMRDNVDFAAENADAQRLIDAVQQIIDNISLVIDNDDEEQEEKVDDRNNCLSYCQALVLQCKWMLLVKENQNISHAHWTKYQQKFYQQLQVLSTKKLLGFMRRVIFKAAILCEIFGGLRARDDRLSTMTEVEDEEEKQNEQQKQLIWKDDQKDIIRQFQIKKIIQKEIVAAEEELERPEQERAKFDPERNEDEIEKTQEELKRWINEQNSPVIKECFKPLMNMAYIFKVQEHCTDVLINLIEAYKEGQDFSQRKPAFVSIAKVLAYYSNYEQFMKDQSKNIVDLAVTKMQSDRTMFCLNFKEDLINQSELQKLEIEEKVCVIRALYDLLRLLKKCQPEMDQNERGEVFLQILIVLKELVSEKKEDDVKENNVEENDEEEEGDEGGENQEQKGEEESKQEQEKHLKLTLAESKLEKVEDVMKKLKAKYRSPSDAEDDMTKFSKLDEDLIKFGIGEKTKRTVMQNFAGNPEEKDTNKQDGAGEPLLWFCNKAKDAALKEIEICQEEIDQKKNDKIQKGITEKITKAQQLSNRLIEQMYNHVEIANKSYQAAKDMNCYFMQQIWLQNYPKIFEFFVYLIPNNMGEKLLKAIWVMPDAPKSEIQELNLREEFNGYLPKLQKKFNMDLHSVQTTMLIAMSECLMSKALTSIDYESQITVVEIFVEFMKVQMSDFRLRQDRSNMMQKVQSAERIEEESNVSDETRLSILYQIVYFFLRQYFRWGGNYKRKLSKDDSIDDVQVIKKHNEARGKTKSNLMKDSDQFFMMVFEIKPKEKEIANEESKQQQSSQTEEQRLKQLPNILQESFAYINDFEDTSSIIFLYCIQFFDKMKEVEFLLDSRKNLKSMLEKLLANLSQEKNALEFKEPFKSFGIKTVYSLLSKFTRSLSNQLIESQEDAPQIQEYKPIFVGTWLIMLQIYIVRSRQIIEEANQEDDDQQEEEVNGQDEAEEEESKEISVANLFENLLRFWKKSKEISQKKFEKHSNRLNLMQQQLERNKQLLIPSKEQVEKLRQNQIPQLLDIIGKQYEAQNEDEYQKSQTLKDLLKFLIMYSCLIFEPIHSEKRKHISEQMLHENYIKNRNNPKMIDIIPILTKISEEILLKYSYQYQKESIQIDHYLAHCGQFDTCPTCSMDNQKEDSMLIFVLNQALARINTKQRDTTKDEREFLSKAETETFPDLYDTGFKTIGQTNMTMQTLRITTRGNTKMTGTFNFTTGAQQISQDNQFAGFLLQYLDNFVEIERRIFLNEVSKQMTKKCLEDVKIEEAKLFDKVKQKIVKLDGLQKAETSLAWFEREQETQQIADQKQGQNEEEKKELQAKPDEENESFKSKKSKLDKEKKAAQKALGLLPEDCEDEFPVDSADVSQDEEKSMNQFYAAYSAYMLLKVKIKHQVYLKADDILKETDDCIEKNNALRAMIPFEARSFMTVETAFLLKETIDAINDLIEQKTKMNDQVWLLNFKPTEGSEIVERMTKLVDSLAFAGFPLDSIRMQQRQLKQFINHDQIINPKGLAPGKEKERIENLSDKLTQWVETIARHSEEQTVEDPGYCSYQVVRFYGKDFPDELTRNKQGFVMRIKYTQDLQKITRIFRKVFNGNRMFQYVKKEKMKVVNLTTYDENKIQVPGVGKPTHWQDNPVIVICDKLEPMSNEVLQTYKVKDFDNDKEKEDESVRDNFKLQKKQNYCDTLYCKSTFPKESLKKSCEKKIHQDLIEIINDRIGNVITFNTKKEQEELQKPDMRSMFDKYLQDQITVQQIATAVNKTGQEVDAQEVDAFLNRCFADEVRYDIQINPENTNSPFIKEEEWKEKYSDRFQRLTGMSIKNPPVKEWKEFMTEKKQALIKDKMKYWKAKAVDRYQKVLNDRDQIYKWSFPQIEIEYVEKIIMKNINFITNYHEQAIDIIKVPLPFPSGFQIQQIDSVDQRIVSGPAFAVHEINEMMQNVEDLTEKFNKTCDQEQVQVAFTKNTNEIELRQKSFENLKSAGLGMLQAIHTLIQSGVSGGVVRYIDLFFIKGSIHVLNSTNEQFHDLLLVFMTLQKMGETIKASLSSFQQFLQAIKTFNPDDNGEFKEQLENYQKEEEDNLKRKWDYLDDFIEALDKVRENHDLDNLLADARDDMDIENEDWD